MNLDKILNLALNKALIGKDRIKQVNSNEIADFVNKHLESINHTCRCKDNSELLKVLEYARQIKNSPKEIQLIIYKLYAENL